MDDSTRRRIVKTGYNRLAGTYAGERQYLKSGKYLQALMARVKPGAVVLDIGCGDGVPVAETLIRKGYLVTGIDIAERMIAQARQHCPRGAFVVREMETLQPGEYRVGAVVCMYALFHIPRDRHGIMLKTMHSFLPAGGVALVTMGDKDFEGKHRAFGVDLWSSQWGPEKNRQLIQQTGFEILLDELDTSGGERHQILLLQKQVGVK